MTYWATLTRTGRQARARPISSTPKKKKLELEARNGRVAGRQLFINETYKWHSSNQISYYCKNECKWEKKKQTHLFYVEDKKVFNSADCRQNRTVKSPNPANCLTINNLQHVLRNGKLLLAPPLAQPTVTVAHNQPEGRMTPQGKRF